MEKKKDFQIQDFLGFFTQQHATCYTKPKDSD